MRSRLAFSLLAIATMLSCMPAFAATPATDAPALIPRDSLFGNPERANVRISPDGKSLSWVAPVDGVLNVWVARSRIRARPCP
jgi:hypothetical protein